MIENVCNRLRTPYWDAPKISVYSGSKKKDAHAFIKEPVPYSMELLNALLDIDASYSQKITFRLKLIKDNLISITNYNSRIPSYNCTSGDSSTDDRACTYNGTILNYRSW